MGHLRFFYLLLSGLLIFYKTAICQVPDFSRVPNMYKGDSMNIVSLIHNGIEIKKKRAVCWFPKDSLSIERMNQIADTISMGIIAAEKFVGAPLSWQVHPDSMPYTFYFRPDTIISHASLGGFVSISFWRIKTGKAPWLHESLHEILFAKGDNWFSRTITDDFFDKNMPLWLSEGLPDYIVMQVSKLQKLPWYDVFSGSINPDMDSVFIENIKSENGQYIVSFIGAKGVMPELSSSRRQQYAPGFYHGSCSFVQFLVNRYGLDLLLKANASFQKEQETIELATGRSMIELKNEWLKQLKIIK